jgi:nucleotide-binding universal stress UspA family protein
MTSKILVPIDLADAPTIEKVLAAAVQQAQSDGAKLVVMTVIPDIIAGLDWRYAIRGEMHGSEEFDMKEIVGEALQRLNEIVADRVPSGMQVETVARRGTVYEQVLEVAEDMGIDQIVIGANRPAVSDFLLGPNTARIVRHATCSVNVIRH